MMYKEDIQKVNEWFDAHTEYYGTSRTEREYSISQYDLDSFADFLRENFPDLCCIRCCFGKEDSAIWKKEPITATISIDAFPKNIIQMNVVEVSENSINKIADAVVRKLAERKESE